jgi:heat shock protein HtpX
VYSQVAANKRKSVYMIIIFMLFIGAMGWLISEYMYGNSGFVVPVLIGALVYVAVMYFISGRAAAALNGAQEIQKRDNPRLYRIVENLAITDGLPMPRVFIMDDPAPNAFATGRDPKHAIVCATTGLLDIMDDSELEGVMAHELGHVKNYDIRVSMIAFALAAVVSILADIILRMSFFGGRNRDENGNSGNQLLFVLAIVAAILAPIAALLIQMAISRRREYLADATGALTTRYPEGLARALQKIGEHGSATRKQNSATAHLFFANPLSRKSISGIFSTHPPLGERIRILREMGNKL